MVIHKKRLVAVLAYSVLLGVSTLVIGNENIGEFDYTMVSRANCINNESLSYTTNLDFVDQYELMTTSWQYDNDTGRVVNVEDGPSNTWRSAAISWGAGVTGSWLVVGTHHATNPSMSSDRCEVMQKGCSESLICAGSISMDVCAVTITEDCSF